MRFVNAFLKALGVQAGVELRMGMAFVRTLGSGDRSPISTTCAWLEGNIASIAVQFGFVSSTDLERTSRRQDATESQAFSAIYTTIIALDTREADAGNSESRFEHAQRRRELSH